MNVDRMMRIVSLYSYEIEFLLLFFTCIFLRLYETASRRVVLSSICSSPSFSSILLITTHSREQTSFSLFLSTIRCNLSLTQSTNEEEEEEQYQQKQIYHLIIIIIILLIEEKICLELIRIVVEGKFRYHDFGETYFTIMCLINIKCK